MSNSDISSIFVSVGTIKGGYDSDLFVDKLAEVLVCPICSGVCRDPQQIWSCGHIFCKSCISCVLSQSRAEFKCPMDNLPVDENEIKDDNFLKRLINTLIIKCPGHPSGCEWKGELDCLGKHLHQCSTTKMTTSLFSNSFSSFIHRSPSRMFSLSSTLPRLHSNRQTTQNRQQHSEDSIDDYLQGNMVDLVSNSVFTPLVEDIPSTDITNPPPPLPPRNVINNDNDSTHTTDDTSTQDRPIVNLNEQTWFRENLSRKEAERYLISLAAEGTFVVRPSMTRIQGNYSLTIYHERQILHFRIQKIPDGMFVLGESQSKSFATVNELIDFYTTHCIYMHDGRNTILNIGDM